MKKLHAMISALFLSQLAVGCGVSEDHAPSLSEAVGAVRASLQPNLKDKTLVLRLETKKIYPYLGNTIKLIEDKGFGEVGFGISAEGIVGPKGPVVLTALGPAVGSLELGIKYDKDSETNLNLADTFPYQVSGDSDPVSRGRLDLAIIIRGGVVELVRSSTDKELTFLGSEITTPQQFVAPGHSLFLAVLNGLESDVQSLLEQAAAIKGLKVVENHGLKAINLPSSHHDWVTSKNSKIFEVSSDFDPKDLENLSSPNEIYFEYEILSENGDLTTNTIRAKKISPTTSLGGVQ